MVAPSQSKVTGEHAHPGDRLEAFTTISGRADRDGDETVESAAARYGNRWPNTGEHGGSGRDGERHLVRRNVRGDVEAREYDIVDGWRLSLRFGVPVRNSLSSLFSGTDSTARAKANTGSWARFVLQEATSAIQSSAEHVVAWLAGAW